MLPSPERIRKHKIHPLVMSDNNTMSGSMSRSSSQANCLDPLDSLLDLSSYETMTYGSPSISPCESAKSVSFHTPTAAAAVTPTANTLLPPRQQTLAGPSHPYDAHKQQTGIPTGGLATTLAFNNNSQMYAGYGYLSGVDASDDFSGIGFGATSTSGSASSSSFEQLNMDLDYESPTMDPAFFFPPMPTATDYSASPTTPQQPAIKVESSNVGRLWPGMHQQQAALAAKAQQQRKQQQYLIQQQRQSSSSVTPSTHQTKTKTRPATDPIVEEKISQLLNSMRQNSEASSNGDDASTPNGQMGHGHRSRKDEEDMDEDERLLASEEGKKLSSKERRQLRNKVSARAFRSRRKEYIGQLEGEISTKVNENTALRTENRALREENARLTDLTRMLLSSPSFSGFLDKLSTNPDAVSEAAQRQQPTPPAASEPQQQQQQEQQQQQSTASTYVSKDVNPYLQQQQLDMNINYAMLPDAAPLDLSLIDLSQHDFIYQPQVFSVHSVEEISIDTSILSGKSSSASTSFIDDDKLDIPIFTPSIPEKISSPPTAIETGTTTTSSAPPKPDAAFDSDPLFSLFAPCTTSTSTTVAPSQEPLPLDTTSLIAAIQPAKQFLQFELVDAAEAEMQSERAVMRVQRLCVSIDAVAARLECLLGDDA